MLDNTMLVAQQVAILFIIMGTGVLAAKVGWLRGDGAKQMTILVFYISTPCVIINSFLSVEITPDLVENIINTAVFAVAAHVLGFIVSRPFFRKQPRTRQSIYWMCVPFSNCGFMGIPLASGIFGPECVIYISVYIAVFNLFAWTYGVSLFRPGKKVSPRALVVNPGTLSLIVGLLIAALRWSPPAIIHEPVRILSGFNSPLAMIILGYHLYASSMRPKEGEGTMWIPICLRLVAVPVIAIAVSYAMGLSGLWLAASLVLTAAPCATNVLMFATLFEGDTGLAARTVSYCTLVSMLTMPVLLGLSLALFPL